MDLIPVADYILVKKLPIPDYTQDRSFDVRGLARPFKPQNAPIRVEVLAIGPGLLSPHTGTVLRHPPYSQGEQILVHVGCGWPVDHKGEECLLVNEGHIVARMKE